MQILRRAINRILPDNRGASMVTVLITVAFLVILTSVLLFMAYTGYVVKVAQAVGENRFYDAETAMDEVRAGLQGLVSDGIAVAYSNVLTGFTGSGDIDKAFTEEFGYIFLLSENLSGAPLFTLPSAIADVRDLFKPTPLPLPYDPIQSVTFDVAFLQGFIKNPPGAGTAVLSISNAPTATSGSVAMTGAWMDHDANPVTPDQFVVDTITIKGLRVTHTSPDGYHSVVDSDVAFGMPNLSYARSLLSFSGISNFAFIATGVMNSPGVSIDVEGSAYFGSVGLDGIGLPVTFRGGTFISGEDVTVVGRELIVEDSASLWARNIVVGGRTGGAASTSLPGYIDFRGNTYAAGSLMLEGNKSSATLAGRYYGFGVGGYVPGPGETEIPNPNPDPVLSSSILVNSRENVLDLDELNMLFLAGHSFINTDVNVAGYLNTNVLTGQSMAVRADQLAYLIPASHIENMTANPMVIPRTGEGSNLVPEIVFGDLEAPLWGTPATGAASRKLSHYINPANINTAVQTVRRPLGDSDQDIFYVFMRFTQYNDRSAIENANLYFKDYFERNVATNPAEVQAYLNLYLGGVDGLYAQARQTTSAGITYTINHLDIFNINKSVIDSESSGSTFNPSIATRYASEYGNRRRTLSRDFIDYNFGSNPENPFHYVVKEQPPEGLYRFEGVPRAIVNHDSSITTLSALLAEYGLSSANIGDIKIIIHYGNITGDFDVNVSGFEGLILCDGNINVIADIKAGGKDLGQALRARINPGDAKRLGDYLNIQIIDEASDETADAWDFNELVYFDNWKKN